MRLYGVATRALVPVLPAYLRYRIGTGMEDPARWREKLGEPGAERPPGPLVWMHAVGLGEVLALRGLIDRMSAARPDLGFLVTSTAYSSSQVFARQRPPRTLHQFLPLDAPPFVRRFLDHWRPDLSVWAEQDIWPGAVIEADRRGIPLAQINARLGDRSLRSRSRARKSYAALYRRFGFISAQNPETADRLASLGARDVAVHGSMKPASPPLADAPDDRARLEALTRGRALWLAASTHPPDEALVLAAEALRRRTEPTSLLILVPRLPVRRAEIRAAAEGLGLTVACRSEGQTPGPGTAVYLADTFGELGLWYRLARVAFVGGSTGGGGGHNPWEPALLGCAVLHGPDVANFSEDYAAFHAADAARAVATPEDLAAALAGPCEPLAANAARLVAGRQSDIDDLVLRLLALLKARDA